MAAISRKAVIELLAISQGMVGHANDFNWAMVLLLVRDSVR
jgi:hypothetical protein